MCRSARDSVRQLPLPHLHDAYQALFIPEQRRGKLTMHGCTGKAIFIGFSIHIDYAVGGVCAGGDKKFVFNERSTVLSEV